MKSNSQAGFTLLEVLVAITLTALVMGSLFSLQSQSSKLGFSSMQAIDQTVNRRAALNLAWMNTDMLEELDYKADNQQKLPIPEILEGKINSNMLNLESFDLLDANGNVIHSSVHLKKDKS